MAWDGAPCGGCGGASRSHPPRPAAPPCPPRLQERRRRDGSGGCVSGGPVPARGRGGRHQQARRLSTVVRRVHGAEGAPRPDGRMRPCQQVADTGPQPPALHVRANGARDGARATAQRPAPVWSAGGAQGRHGDTARSPLHLETRACRRTTDSRRRTRRGRTQRPRRPRARAGAACPSTRTPPHPAATAHSTPARRVPAGGTDPARAWRGGMRGRGTVVGLAGRRTAFVRTGLRKFSGHTAAQRQASCVGWRGGHGWDAPSGLDALVAGAGAPAAIGQVAVRD